MPKLYRDATTGQYTTAADAAARPAETVSETAPTRREAPDVAELRGQIAETIHRRICEHSRESCIENLGNCERATDSAMPLISTALDEGHAMARLLADALKDAIRTLRELAEKAAGEPIPFGDSDLYAEVVDGALDAAAERDALAEWRGCSEAEIDSLKAMLAGRCLSDITHRDEEHRQSICMLPAEHAPLAHDDCMGCTWTDADHWQPQAVDRVADELQRIADDSQHEGWDHPIVRKVVARLTAALDASAPAPQP